MENIFVEPIGLCLLKMESYIYNIKGVKVKIKTPQTKKEIELFEKMYNFMSNKFKI